MHMSEKKIDKFHEQTIKIMAEQNFKILFYLTIYIFILRTLFIVQQIYYYIKEPKIGFIIYIILHAITLVVTLAAYLIAKKLHSKELYNQLNMVYHVFVITLFILVLIRTVFDIFKFGNVESFIGGCVELSFLYISPEVYMTMFSIIIPIIYGVLVANYGLSMASCDIILNNMVIIFSLMLFTVIKYRNRKVAIYKQLESKELYEKDTLSKLYNRLSLNNYMDSISEDDVFKGAIILDIDNFKSVNDTYGHLIGDKVIERVGEVLNTYNSDVSRSFRYGGEEFLVLFKEYNEENIYNIAEQIRNEIADLVIDNIKVTVSLGAFENKDSLDAAKLINEADELLYTAKNSGKNKTVCNITPYC